MGLIPAATIAAKGLGNLPKLCVLSLVIYRGAYRSVSKLRHPANEKGRASWSGCAGLVSSPCLVIRSFFVPCISPSYHVGRLLFDPADKGQVARTRVTPIRSPVPLNPPVPL